MNNNDERDYAEEAANRAEHAPYAAVTALVTPEPAAMTPERREQLRGRIAACIDDTPDVVGWETARHLLAEVDRLSDELDDARTAAGARRTAAGARRDDLAALILEYRDLHCENARGNMINTDRLGEILCAFEDHGVDLVGHVARAAGR